LGHACFDAIAKWTIDIWLLFTYEKFHLLHRAMNDQCSRLGNSHSIAQQTIEKMTFPFIKKSVPNKRKITNYLSFLFFSFFFFFFLGRMKDYNTG
jgi:hypothetical protein